MKRYLELSLRRSEKTRFYFNDSEDIFWSVKKALIYRKQLITLTRQWLTTVTELASIIVERRANQVDQVTSAQREQLVTMLEFASASGNHVPPIFMS